MVTRSGRAHFPTYDDTRNGDLFVLSGVGELLPERVGLSEPSESQGQVGSSRQTEHQEPTAPQETSEPSEPSAQPELSDQQKQSRSLGSAGRNRVIHRDGYRITPYLARHESAFIRTEKWTDSTTGEVHWRTVDGDGITSIYGITDNGRVSDPEHPDRVFRWLLERRFDSLGNVQCYEYKGEDTCGVDTSLSSEYRRVQTGRFTNRYLKRVLYGNSLPADPRTGSLAEQTVWHFRVVLDYGEHDLNDPTDSEIRNWPVRKDPFSHFSAGFEIRCYRLCRQIMVFHQMDELGPEPVLSDSLCFDYSPLTDSAETWGSTDSTSSSETSTSSGSATPSGSSGHSDSSDTSSSSDPSHPSQPIDSRPSSEVEACLTSISRRGYRRTSDGELNYKEIPPLELTYTPSKLQSEPDGEIHELEQNSDISEHLVDLYGEGVSGLLRQSGDTWYYRHNLGGGRFSPSRPVDDKPSDSSEFRPRDIEQDGELELARDTGTAAAAGFHGLTRDHDGWSRFRPFDRQAEPGVSGAHQEWMDLSGNSLPDLVVPRQGGLTWYESEGAEGYARPRAVSLAEEQSEGPAWAGHSPETGQFIANLSGSGQDIVSVSNGKISWWPHLGYGRYGQQVTMDDVPLFDHPDRWDPHRIRFVDLNGTGRSDVIYLGESGVSYWLNHGGNRLGRKQTLKGCPPAHDHLHIQITDLLGEGTPCLTWTSSLPGEAHRPRRYIRLTGEHTPWRLATVSNNMGKEIRIHYDSSARHYLADQRSQEPWESRLIRHLQVVQRIETVDHITGTRYHNRYRYRDGYFDKENRTFGGFARVEQFDTEQFQEYSGLASEDYVAPLCTVTWFHTGSDTLRSGQLKGAYREGVERSLESGVEGRFGKATGCVSVGGDDDRSDTRGDDRFDTKRDLTAQAVEEAHRMLAGRVIREEVYGTRNGERAGAPFQVTETAWQVRCLEPEGRGRPGRFLAYASDIRTFEMDQNPDDPRVIQQSVLKTDSCGYPILSCLLHFPRRAEFAVTPEQSRLCSTVSEKEYLHENERFYRHGLEIGETTYELTGLKCSEAGFIEREELVRQVEVALQQPLEHGQPFVEVPDASVPGASGSSDPGTQGAHDAQGASDSDAPAAPGSPEPGPSAVSDSGLPEDSDSVLSGTSGVPESPEPVEHEGSGALQSRHLHLSRLYYVGAHGEPTRQIDEMVRPLRLHHEEAALFSDSRMQDLYGDRLNEQLLTEAGYHYEAPYWWQPSSEHTWLDQSGFYQLHKRTDPLGGTETLSYDPYHLLVTRTEDAIGNRTETSYDYLALKPSWIRDPNHCITERCYDGLNQLVATTHYGESLDKDGLRKMEGDLPLGQYDQPLDQVGGSGATGNGVSGLEGGGSGIENSGSGEPGMEQPGLDMGEPETGNAVIDNPETYLQGMSEYHWYDLFAWKRDRDAGIPAERARPVSSGVLLRETPSRSLEPQSESRILSMIRYLDGFGREVQTKQAAGAGPALVTEGVGQQGMDQHGAEISGSGRGGSTGSGSFEDGTEDHDATSKSVDLASTGAENTLAGDGGTTTLYEVATQSVSEQEVTQRWLTSGGVVYNNKEDVIREYEPLFTGTCAFEPGETFLNHGTTPVYYYDPLGRHVKTDTPDGFFKKVEFTPWEIRSFDQNDTVKDSFFYQTRMETGIADGAEREAVEKAEAHVGTPDIQILDPMGQTVIQRRVLETGEELDTRIHYDMAGGRIMVVDPRQLQLNMDRNLEDRVATERTWFSMTGRPIYTQHMDSGQCWRLQDAMDRPMHIWTGRGHHTVTRYDLASRPVAVELIDPANPGAARVVESMIYGESLPVEEARERNAVGRIIEHRDQAGVVFYGSYDIHGRHLERSRTLRTGYRDVADWSLPVELESESYRTLYRFDSFGRLTEKWLADGTVQKPKYLLHGPLDGVHVSSEDGELDEWIIRESWYNALEQKTKRLYGSGVESSYHYQEGTHRLSRLLSRRTDHEDGWKTLQDIRFTYDPVGNIVRRDDRSREHLFDQLPSSYGDSNRHSAYTYDSLYRLQKATGWTHQALGKRDYTRNGTPPDAFKGTRHLAMNNARALTPYTRTYSYDRAGNMERLNQAGGLSWKRDMWISESSNRSLLVREGYGSGGNGSGSTGSSPTGSGPTGSGPTGSGPTGSGGNGSENRLESHFDEAGNLKSLDHLEGGLTWNYRNELTSAVLIEREEGADDADWYLYGSDGGRVRRVEERLEHGSIRRREKIWLDGCEIRREYRGDEVSLERTTSMVRDDERTVAHIHYWRVDLAGRESDEPGRRAIHYQLDDGFGSVALEVDPSGRVISYEEYFPYGESALIAGDDIKEVARREYRHAGRERDDATGLCYYGLRYYASWMGRWLKPDPVGSMDGWNLYLYLSGNPVGRTDVAGLSNDEDREQQRMLQEHLREFGSLDEATQEQIGDAWRSHSASGATFYIYYPGMDHQPDVNFVGNSYEILEQAKSLSDDVIMIPADPELRQAYLEGLQTLNEAKDVLEEITESFPSQGEEAGDFEEIMEQMAEMDSEDLFSSGGRRQMELRGIDRHRDGSGDGSGPGSELESSGSAEPVSEGSAGLSGSATGSDGQEPSAGEENREEEASSGGGEGGNESGREDGEEGHDDRVPVNSPLRSGRRKEAGPDSEETDSEGVGILDLLGTELSAERTAERIDLEGRTNRLILGERESRLLNRLAREDLAGEIQSRNIELKLHWEYGQGEGFSEKDRQRLDRRNRVIQDLKREVNTAEKLEARDTRRARNAQRAATASRWLRRAGHVGTAITVGTILKKSWDTFREEGFVAAMKTAGKEMALELVGIAGGVLFAAVAASMLASAPLWVAVAGGAVASAVGYWVFRKGAEFIGGKAAEPVESQPFRAPPPMSEHPLLLSY